MAPTPTINQKPDDFLSIEEALPGIFLDIRYKSCDNFTGRPVVGYESTHTYLTKNAIKALNNVLKTIEKHNLTLKIFDAYRPQKAVHGFMEWAHNNSDLKMQHIYYPNVLKQNLIKDGYIATPSSHSRGSTVDITLCDKNGFNLNMGTDFDFFGKEARLDYKNLTKEQHTNRKLLHTSMISAGFKPYTPEWWHFTLSNEPYPDTYFDF